MVTSDPFTNVINAIHDVQQNVGSIGKANKAEVGKYSYKYADITTIWNAIKEQLDKNGLTVMQAPTSSDPQLPGDFLETKIYHKSGEWVTDKMRLVVTRDDPQGMGAAITYARRYMLTAMFGLIVDDEDNDAANHRLATGEMKKEWVRAFTVIHKKINPDANPTYKDFMKFMEDTYGTELNKVLAKDSQTVLDTIKAFDPGGE